jgi:outer membrane protein
MFKKILLALAIAMAIPVASSAQSKFGVVDIDPIFQALPESVEAQNKLQEASKKYEDEYKKLQEKIEKEYAEYQELSKSTDTPESIKERRMQEIQELSDKIQQFRNTASQDLQRQQQQLMAPIEEKITNAIKAVGQENNFTFIFQNGSAYYTGKDVIDVSSLVKAKLGLK